MPLRLSRELRDAFKQVISLYRYHSPKEGTTHVAVALFFMKYAFVNTNCHFRTESLTTRQILRDAQELKYLKD